MNIKKSIQLLTIVSALAITFVSWPMQAAEKTETGIFLTTSSSTHKIGITESSVYGHSTVVALSTCSMELTVAGTSFGSLGQGNGTYYNHNSVEDKLVISASGSGTCVTYPYYATGRATLSYPYGGPTEIDDIRVDW